MIVLQRPQLHSCSSSSSSSSSSSRREGQYIYRADNMVKGYIIDYIDYKWQGLVRHEAYHAPNNTLRETNRFSSLHCKIQGRWPSTSWRRVVKDQQTMWRSQARQRPHRRWLGQGQASDCYRMCHFHTENFKKFPGSLPRPTPRGRGIYPCHTHTLQHVDHVTVTSRCSNWMTTPRTLNYMTNNSSQSYQQTSLQSLWYVVFLADC